MIRALNLTQLRDKFLSAVPYNHVVIDNFFDEEVANKIASQFPDHDDEVWTVSYDNPVEKKKGCSHWDKFPPAIYSSLFYLSSKKFTDLLQQITGEDNIIADYGLHGGGMHSHNRGGKLNVHEDYSIHPKLPLKRNFNLIIYMTPGWDSSWGGGLELWSHDAENNQPKECVTKVENKFNRAIIFDTTQNSWHGLPEELTCPDNIARRSLAVYYLTELELDTNPRKRAYFAPYKDQKNDPRIAEFCKKRSGL